MWPLATFGVESMKLVAAVDVLYIMLIRFMTAILLDLQAFFVSFCLLRSLISLQRTVFLPGHWSLQVEKYTEPGVMHVTLLDMEAKNIFCRLIYWAKKQRFSSAEKYCCLEEHCTLCTVTVLQILWLCRVNKTCIIFHVMSTVESSSIALRENFKKQFLCPPTLTLGKCLV